MKHILSTLLNSPPSQEIELAFKRIHSSENLLEEERRIIDFVHEFLVTKGHFPSTTYFSVAFPEYDVDLSSPIDVHELEHYWDKIERQRVSFRVSQLLSQVSVSISSGEVSISDLPGIVDDLMREDQSKLNHISDISNLSIETQIQDQLRRKGSKVTFGMAEVDTYIKGVESGTMTVVGGYVGSFKCVVAGTRVLTSDGYVPIELLYPDSQMEFTPLEIDVGYGKSSHFYRSVKPGTVQIKSSRFQLEASPEHPVLAMTSQGVQWRQLQDLNVGDQLAFPRKPPVDIMSGSPRKVKSLKSMSDREWGWLVGYWLGNGSRLFGTRGQVTGITFSSKREVDLDRVSSLIDAPTEKIFNGSGQITLRVLDDRFVNSWCYVVGSGSNFTKTVPEWAFWSNSSFLKGLLEGCYEAKGTLIVFSMCSRSKKLLSGLRSVWNLFGVYPELKRLPSGYYSLESSNLDLVDLSDLQEGRLKDLKLYAQAQLGRKGFRPTIPHCHLYRRELLSILETGRKLYGSRVGWMKYLRSASTDLSVEGLSEFKMKEIFDYIYSFNTKVYDDIYKYRFYPIESVDWVNTSKEVFDLSVPGTHMFYSNGLISHNTTSMVSFCVHNSINGISTSMISLEMPVRYLYAQMLSCFSFSPSWPGSPIPSLSIIKGELSEEDLFDLYKCEEAFKALPGKIFIFGVDDLSGSVDKALPSVCHDLARRGCSTLIVDHVQLLKYYIPGTRDVSGVDSIIKKLTDTALELDRSGHDFRIILLSQINRESYKKALRRGGRYDITAMAEYNELEKSCTYMLAIFSTEEMKEMKEASVQLLKNRLGATIEEPTTVFVDPSFCVFGGVSAISSFDPTESDLADLMGDEFGF